jgi:D-inositol-3-phosphate glycosyltransferase
MAEISISIDKALPRAESMTSEVAQDTTVALLTGGGDKHYALGLTMALLSKGATLEVIGSDNLECPEFHNRPRLNFLNLRGDLRPNASLPRKIVRISKYYARLLRYAATAQPKILHILWNNKFELFDRTLCMLYYKSMGKKIVLTAHNVNAGKRDGKDTIVNRFSLRIQYHLSDHIFIHTEKMKQQLIDWFGVQGKRLTVIPFGVNNAVPNTGLTSAEAKQHLGIGDGERTILFFGRITPYKGLDYLIAAFQQMQARADNCRLIIAGKPAKGCEGYWAAVRQSIDQDVQKGRVVLRAEFIPDDETEVYLKAADVLVLPYRSIYQSGVLFLSYSFGLPVVAADVGSLKDDIVEGETGFVFKAEDPADLANAIETYFASDLYKGLIKRRQGIQNFVSQRHSWDVVGQMTMSVYAGLLGSRLRENLDSERGGGRK